MGDSHKGAIYMLGSALAFSVKSLLVKAAGQRLPSQEIVFARALVSLVLSYALLKRAGIGLWGTKRRLLLLRGVFGFLGLSCVFYALTHLPLAEATVIQYLHPAFTAVLAALVLGEAIGPRLMAALAVSLAGVALVAKPAFLFAATATKLDPLAAAVAVGGALFSAAAYVVVRRLSATEHPLVIVFYFPLVAVPATLPTLWSQALWPRGAEWILLLGVGVATQVGQVCLTRGIGLQPAGRATAFATLQVVFAALFGVFFFAEVPDGWTVLGALLIVSSATLVVLQRMRV